MAMEIISPEGERMDFHPTPVQLDHKQVEDWMKEVETRMRSSVKQCLFLAYKDARSLRRSEDYEKWIKKHHGQTLITASQVSHVISDAMFPTHA